MSATAMTAIAHAIFQGKTLEIEESLPFRIGERLEIFLRPAQETDDARQDKHPGFGLLADRPLDGLELQRRLRSEW